MITRSQFVKGAALLLATGLTGCNNNQPAQGAGGIGQVGDLNLVEEGTLTCVSEIGFAPFEYLDGTSSTPQGFDIDLANEIADRLGLSCVFLPTQDFDTLIPTIKEGGKADIAIAGITITYQREKEIDFTDPYFESNLAICGMADDARVTEDFNAPSVKIACQTGTTGDSWVDENLPEATKITLADVTAGFAGVTTGAYDAYVSDLPVVKRNLKESFTELKIIEAIPTGDQFGIAVSKDNPELTAAINQALALIREDGTLDSIWEKWMVDTDAS